MHERESRQLAASVFNYKITQLPNYRSLNSPQVIFLLRLLVVRIGVNRQRHAERVGLRRSRKRLVPAQEPAHSTTAAACAGTIGSISGVADPDGLCVSRINSSR